MRNGFTLNAIAITLLLILNCGCGSNRVELPGSQPGQVPVDDSLTVTSPDGLLTLVFPAGSLPPNTDVTIEESPPAFPFVSKLYTVQPVGLFLNKPARLSLAAEAVSLNQSVSQTVGVRSDEGAVAWLDSTFADATYTVPIYFLSRFGLGESGSVTDEEQARTKFVSSVIPITDEIDEFESGTGGTPFRDSIAGYGPYAMEKGDNVGRATSQYRYNYPPDGNPPELVEIPIDDFVASDDGWFFWLDMADQTLFEHPTLYLFLSKQNGRLTIFRQDETPQLRGEDILFSNEVRLNSDKRIFGPDPQPSDIVAQQSITPLEIQDCKRLALILKATNEGFVQNTVADIRTGLGTIGIPIVERRITNPGDIKTIIDEIVRFQRDECDCEGFDEVFVYLVAHGQDAGSFIYKDENGKTLRPKTSSRGLSTNNRFILGEKEAIQTNFMDFLLDLSRICRKRPDPETQIGESGVLNIFIEACYSGAGLEELIKARDSFKDTAVANSERVKQILCFRANVITACDFDETSKGRYFTSPFNKRQQATAQFVRDLTLDTQGRIDMNATFIKGLDEPFFFYPQLPRYEFFPGAVTNNAFDPSKCDCCPKDITIDADQTALDFQHVVGETPCPQMVGDVVITNRGIDPVDIGASSNNPAIEVTPGVVLGVLPGETATFKVLFNCSTSQSFQASIEFLALDAQDREARVSIPVSGTITQP